MVSCEMCNIEQLLEYFSCEACTMDLCIFCATHLGREAHQLRRGQDHQFGFHTVRPTTCDICLQAINRDFIRCRQCVEEQIPVLFDICLDCSIKTDSVLNHALTSGSAHRFKRVEFTPSFPLQQPQVVSVVDSSRYASWVCDICRSRLHGRAFVCLDCSGNDRAKFSQCDLCDDCAEKGRLAKHVRESGHTFLWYSLDIKPTRQREGAPPPYNGFSH